MEYKQSPLLTKITSEKVATEITYWSTAADEIDSESWIIDEVNILGFRPLHRYSLKLKQPVPNSSAQEKITIFVNKIFEQTFIFYLTFVKYIY